MHLHLCSLLTVCLSNKVGHWDGNGGGGGFVGVNFEGGRRFISNWLGLFGN